jgi:hypothetical protein
MTLGSSKVVPTAGTARPAVPYAGMSHCHQLISAYAAYLASVECGVYLLAVHISDATTPWASVETAMAVRCAENHESAAAVVAALKERTSA